MMSTSEIQSGILLVYGATIESPPQTQKILNTLKKKANAANVVVNPLINAFLKSKILTIRPSRSKNLNKRTGRLLEDLRYA